MRKVLEVLRLKFDGGLGVRAIALSTGIGKSTVSDYLARFAAAGLSWPLPSDMDEAQLEARLFPVVAKETARVLPDFGRVDVELRRKHVTLALLWTEYREEHGEAGYQYSWFCEQYQQWRKKQRLWMRQHHVAGDKLFVDFSGDGLELVDPVTGEVRGVKLFVAALGASSYTYARATLDETAASFLDCNTRTLEFIGGVPAAIVPDNAKAAVTKADRYEPDVNTLFADFGAHYGTCILPARPYKPRDKAKVEVAVQVAQRWIIAVLRNREFHSLVDLNDAIEELLDRLNNRVMRHLGRTRKQLFDEVDRPALKPLPVARYEYAEWSVAKVHPDYHVEVDRHFYSAPYQHRGERVDVRVTARTVEIFLRGRRIASHARSRRKWHYTTLPEHMPPAHLAAAQDSSISQVLVRAEAAGPSTHRFCQELMARRRHPEQAIKACLGVLSLLREYGRERVEAACRRGIRFSTYDRRSIKNILATGLDKRPLDDEPAQPSLPLHENIRGSGYFH